MYLVIPPTDCFTSSLRLTVSLTASHHVCPLSNFLAAPLSSPPCWNPSFSSALCGLHIPPFASLFLFRHCRRRLGTRHRRHRGHPHRCLLAAAGCRGRHLLFPQPVRPPHVHRRQRLRESWPRRQEQVHRGGKGSVLVSARIVIRWLLLDLFNKKYNLTCSVNSGKDAPNVLVTWWRCSCLMVVRLLLPGPWRKVELILPDDHVLAEKPNHSRLSVFWCRRDQTFLKNL